MCMLQSLGTYEDVWLQGIPESRHFDIRLTWQFDNYIFTTGFELRVVEARL
jgi:hypothetical protein